ncbi:MAG: chemotaxis protein CheW [Thermoanaerobaculia bacterium]|nr:chemotaxis protein CheW [Thermoanaerobaculia bacterium]
MERVGIVTFTLSGESFGITSMAVREIAKSTEMTPVEGAPAEIEGAIVYQGQTIPVLDLHPHFGLGAHGEEIGGNFIIAECEKCLVALEVDAVTSVVEIPRTWVVPGDGGEATEPRQGIVRTPEGLCVISDVNRLLDGVDPEVLLASAQSVAHS